MSTWHAVGCRNLRCHSRHSDAEADAAAAACRGFQYRGLRRAPHAARADAAWRLAESGGAQSGERRGGCTLSKGAVSSEHKAAAAAAAALRRTERRAALLAAITINDEVRDIAVERLDAAKSMVRAACAYLCAHRHDRSNPTRPYPLRPPFPVSADQLPKPEVLANYPGLPPWLKLGLMRLAPRTNVDPDELYYTAEQVRLNGEFWPDFECYSEYFTSAEVTLISGSDVLQATR